MGAGKSGHEQKRQPARLEHGGHLKDVLAAKVDVQHGKIEITRCGKLSRPVRLGHDGNDLGAVSRKQAPQIVGHEVPVLDNEDAAPEQPLA